MLLVYSKIVHEIGALILDNANFYDRQVLGWEKGNSSSITQESSSPLHKPGTQGATLSCVAQSSEYINTKESLPATLSHHQLIYQHSSLHISLLGALYTWIDSLA